MSPPSPPAQTSLSAKSSEQGDDQKKKSDASKVPRKRTKTGCLTCRKRRIKCDEEKPTCANCAKSRRHCEGYNPRIVFRRSRTNPSAEGAMPFPVPYPGTIDTSYQGYPMQQQQYGFQEMPNYYHPGQIAGAQVHNPSNTTMPELSSPEDGSRPSWQYSQPEYERVPLGYHQSGDANVSPYSYQHRPGSSAGGGPPTDQPELDRSAQHQGSQSFYPTAPKIQTSVMPARGPIFQSAPAQDVGWAHDVSTAPGHQEPYSASTVSSYFTPISAYPNHAEIYQHPQETSPGIQTRHNFYSEPRFQNPGADWASHAPGSVSEFHKGLANKPDNLAVPLTVGQVNTSVVLDAAAVETEDDDYYDIHSDEEDEAVVTKALATDSQSQRELGMIMALYHKHADELGIRSMDAFITPGFVDIYRPERVANPLRNEATARVFAHFITSTGPLLSPFERYHGAQANMFRQGSYMSGTKSLWTHTLPMMALHNQGLLHAILAMSSMHMAKLSGSSPASSFKHYAWSIKRVHKAVSQNRKRHEITTLAATLLLAFYEVMTADHMNWTKHLMGARQLIKELDFAGMLQHVRGTKRAREDAASNRDDIAFFSGMNDVFDATDSFLDRFHDIDHRTISYFMGRDVHHERGCVEKEFQASSGDKETGPSVVDFHNFEVLQDLFWWYCKQDMVHAGLAGTAPLLEFDDWAACPPRSPPGDLETVCGSFDHLVLLMGRIVTFAGEDRPRKLKASSRRSVSATPSVPVTSSQGQDPNTKDSSATAPKSPMPQIPFYGMAPLKSSRIAPSAYETSSYSSISATEPQTAPSDESLDENSARALEQWNQIQATLDTFATMLGPAFEPMGKDEYQEAETPFGPMIMYRRYDIACLWMFYHMARIMHARAHPSMPPAAILAVPMAAKQTAEDAIKVGRIASSVTLNVTSAPLHPAIAGAFTDSSLPLFWAGVQYSDAAQRAWTIHRLKEIEDHTGYASASMLALGCETSWTRAAERGGPPYIRSAAISIPQDPRVRADIEGRPRVHLFRTARAAGEPIPIATSAYGAVGLLGTIEDLKMMSLSEGKRS